MLGVIFRHFYRDFDTEMLVRLYVTLVRPRLEYASPVWSPHTEKDIKQLELIIRVFRELPLNLFAVLGTLTTWTCYLNLTFQLLRGEELNSLAYV